MRTNRRILLTCLAATAGSAAAVGRLRCPGAARAEPVSIALLRSLMDDPDSAGVIGTRYRQLFPIEDHPRVLAAAIVAALGIADGEPVDREQLRSCVGARVRAEFAAGDSVRVAGWVLARTEARLWALCA